jgi:hypothetical protein
MVHTISAFEIILQQLVFELLLESFLHQIVNAPYIIFSCTFFVYHVKQLYSTKKIEFVN